MMYMKFMKKTKFVRVSGPYRDVEFGGSTFGHSIKTFRK